MNFEEHLRSYRAAIKKDALEGADQYAREMPTATPEVFPTVYHYLNNAISGAINAARGDDFEAYKTWLTHHRDALLALFQRMVDEVLAPDDYDFHTIIELLSKKGWRWFKYARRGLEFRLTVTGDFRPEILWLPRYDQSFPVPSDKAVFDTDEMEILVKNKGGPAVSRPVIEFKLGNPAMKILEFRNNVAYYKPVPSFNQGGVLDWTMDLFPRA